MGGRSTAAALYKFLGLFEGNALLIIFYLHAPSFKIRSARIVIELDELKIQNNGL